MGSDCHGSRDPSANILTSRIFGYFRLDFRMFCIYLFRMYSDTQQFRPQVTKYRRSIDKAVIIKNYTQEKHVIKKTIQQTLENFNNLNHLTKGQFKPIALISLDPR